MTKNEKLKLLTKILNGSEVTVIDAGWHKTGSACSIRYHNNGSATISFKKGDNWSSEVFQLRFDFQDD